jgi:tRNA 2-thiocytidine biosynthesis protein TtcA
MIHRVVRRNIAALIDLKLQPGDIRCSLCSRLRRGVLYNTAEELQCTKIALGHHRDDLIETLLMNLFFNGRISSMPPVLKSDDQRNTVIRPLCYVPEEDLIAMINALSYPIFHCFNCASINGQRAKIKKLLVELEKENPTIKQTLLRSLGKVNPSHLMDRELWSF